MKYNYNATFDLIKIIEEEKKKYEEILINQNKIKTNLLFDEIEYDCDYEYIIADKIDERDFCPYIEYWDEIQLDKSQRARDFNS